MTSPSLPETELASFAADFPLADIPASVLHEAKRSLVNIFATALAGSREPALDIILRTMQPFGGAPTATLIGRSERVDAALAAFVNAAGANIFDFDDTHEATIIHPACAVFAPLFALAETSPAPGSALLRAFVLGGEVTCRIGNAISPGHYTRGWHITSTSGVFGAAAAAGALLKLSPAGMLHAFSAAAVQSSGMVEALGTMAKSLAVGGAARNGMVSALLAKNDLTGPAAILSGARGYFHVYADTPSPHTLLAGLGEIWEIAANTYKPYPVGVVLNPVVEAILRLRKEKGVGLDDVQSIEVTGHPLLRERTDRPDVGTGRETQVSAQHAVAIALLRGRAGLDEFTDEAAKETLRLGRPAIAFHDDPARGIASIKLLARTRSGDEHMVDIDAALGSRANPLSDRQLEEKLKAAASSVGWRGNPDRLLDALWRIDDVDDAGEIVKLAAAP